MSKRSSSPASSDGVQPRAGRVGTCVVYDRAGNELWRQSEFRVGVDRVPPGLSMGMGAMVVVSDDGEAVARWNPWGVL